MGTADKSATERKQYREKTTVGRDKASPETVNLLNSLRRQIDDPDTAAAVAMLHAQINGDNPDYQRPPSEAPFGFWHATISASLVEVKNITSNGVTVDIELTEFDLFDTDAEVYLRFIEDTDTVDRQVVETAPITMTTTGTETFTTDSLNADTPYDVQAVVRASVNTKTVTKYSDTAAFTTGK